MKKFLLSFVLGVSLVFGGRGGVLAETYKEESQKCAIKEIEKNGHSIDRDSFQFLSSFPEHCRSGFAKDVNHIYFYNDVFEDEFLLDKNSFSVIDGSSSPFYLKDKNSIYKWENPRDGNELITIKNIDISSFQIISAWGYSKDKEHIYYDDKIIPWVTELESFEELNFHAGYARDKNHIYYEEHYIHNADIQSFKLIDYGEGGLSKDKNNIYYKGFTLPKDVDINSFKLLKKFDFLGWVARDNKGIILNSERLNGDLPDMETIEVINVIDSGSPLFDSVGVYLKDKNSVYKEIDGTLMKIPEISTNTVTAFHNLYIKDDISVFFQTQKLKNSDPKTFQVIEESYYYLDYLYAKDKNNVYFYGNIIPHADPKTFEFLSASYSKDKNNVYYVQTSLPLEPKNRINALKNAKIVILKNADPKTFISIVESTDEKKSYGKDTGFVFKNDKTLNSMHPGTFKVIVMYAGCGGCINIDYSKDKNGVYYEERKIKEADLDTIMQMGEVYFLMDKNNIYKEIDIINQNDLHEYEKDMYNYTKEKIEKRLKNRVFTDLFISDEKYESIQFVKNKNLVKGYSNGTYRPENSITRAEFTKIILLAKYSQEEIDSVETRCTVSLQENCFSDINSGDWYKNYVNFAKETGIIKGFIVANTSTPLRDRSEFRPNQKITFAEASKIIVNVLLENSSLDSAREPLENSAEWWVPFVEQLKEKGVEIYDPEKNLTRGEMAELIYGLKNFVK